MDPLRRKFLLGSLGAAGAATLANVLSVAKASNSVPTVTDQYYVFVYFSGGWDTILSLDPKDPTFYDDQALTIAEYGVETGYGVFNLPEGPIVFNESAPDMLLGPFVGDLVDWAPRMSIVRGMTVSSVAHGTGMIHALTGKTPAGALPRSSSIATLLATALGENELIPNLVSGTPTFNLDQPTWASGINASNVNDLQDILKPSLSSLEAGDRAALEEFFDKSRQRTNQPRLHSIYDNHRTSRHLIEENIAEYFDPTSPLWADLTAEVGSGTLFMAYQALTKGVSRCVSYVASPFSDAHAGNMWVGSHPYHLESMFNSVSKLAHMLDATPYPSGGTWLDHTTIVCQSEFNRSPTRNGGGGRDHATTNTCLFLGGGIKGGQVIGATHEQNMASQPIDLATGLVDDNGVRVNNENIAVTLLKSIGITEDIGDYRAPAIDALLV